MLGRTKRVIPVVFAIGLIFLVLTVSIGLPIYCRPFYYAHIDALELDQVSGFSKAQIRTAYDQVLDYLTIPGAPFGTGELRHSPDGASHFADCKVLFDLNAGVLLASFTLVLGMVILRKLGKLPSLKRGAFYAGVGAITLPLVVGGLAALDFDRAFVIFHHIFFPSKDNWIFSYYEDEIIRVLPQEFFMHCAILIGAGILLLSILLMWLGRKPK